MLASERNALTAVSSTTPPPSPQSPATRLPVLADTSCLTLQDEKPASEKTLRTASRASFTVPPEAAAQPSRGTVQHICANTNDMSLVVAGLVAHVFDTRLHAATAFADASSAVEPQATSVMSFSLGRSAAQRS